MKLYKRDKNRLVEWAKTIVQKGAIIDWFVHSIRQVTNGGRGRVGVFTYRDRITKVVPWSILGGTSVQRIGT